MGLCGHAGPLYTVLYPAEICLHHTCYPKPNTLDQTLAPNFPQRYHAVQHVWAAHLKSTTRCAVVVVLLAGNPTRLDGAAGLAAVVWTPSIVL
jgi:hypothetical protein